MLQKQIVDGQEWEAAVHSFATANFLQSWAYGSFQEKLGKRVYRLYQQDRGLVGIAQLVIEPAKRGRYAAIAGGPLLPWDDTAFVQAFFKQLSAVARAERCHSIRFRPQLLAADANEKLLQSIGARLAPMHLTADLTLQLDLRQSEEELLAQMRKNTRYEVKKAERLGIMITTSTDPADIRSFYDTQVAVAQRHHFVPFSYEFLYEQFKAFAQTNEVVLITSWQGGQPLATAFVIFYNGEAVYHYGVSTDANAKLPGAYAVQWAAISEAQRRGCTRYNFWGVAPESAKEHRFAGVSLFKRGFGGSEVAYLPAQDIPLSPMYWITWLFEQLRRTARHL